MAKFWGAPSNWRTLLFHFGLSASLGRALRLLEAQKPQPPHTRLPDVPQPLHDLYLGRGVGGHSPAQEPDQAGRH